MAFTIWLLYVGTEAAFSLSPGPAVLMVVSQTLRGGMRGGQLCALGVLAGNQVFFGLSAVLIATATTIDPEYFHLLRWAGVAWLLWLAGRPLQLWLTGSGNGAAQEGRARGAGDAGEYPPPAAEFSAPPGGGVFLAGLLMQLANPKTIFFFAAFIPQFIDPRGSLALQFGILAATSFCVEYTILSGYCLLTREARNRFGERLGSGRMALAGNLGLAAAVGWWLIKG